MATSRAYRIAVALVALAGCARALAGYAALAARLAGRSYLDRGAIASSEGERPLARAGRLRLQRAYDEAREAGTLDAQRSAVADGWSFVAGAAASVPPDARIYLDLPSEILYYYGTTLWYPARVEVG